MHSLLNSKKGQFFIVTVVGLTLIFLMMSKIFSPYNIIDTSEVLTVEEPYFFNNIKEGLIKTVEISDCNELQQNLKTFKDFATSLAGEKGYKLRIYYNVTNCSVNASIELTSVRSLLKTEFYVTK